MSPIKSVGNINGLTLGDLPKVSIERLEIGENYDNLLVKMIGVNITIFLDKVNHQLFQFHPEFQILCGGIRGRFLIGWKTFFRIVAKDSAIVVEEVEVSFDAILMKMII